MQCFTNFLSADKKDETKKMKKKRKKKNKKKDQKRKKKDEKKEFLDKNAVFYVPFFFLSVNRLG